MARLLFCAGVAYSSERRQLAGAERGGIIMTLDRFKVFAAAARHRGITRASEELHVTQSAITKQLKSLEREFNADLYKRSGRGIELTEAGLTFLRGVKKILKDYDSLIQIMRTSRSLGKVETLTVGGSYSPSVFLLPALLAQFRSRHPLVQMNFRTADKYEIERMILNSEVDIAVVTNAPVHPGITAELYRHDPVVAFAMAHHPLTRKPEMSLQEIERVPLIVRKGWQSQGGTARLLGAIKKQGIHANIAMRCDSPEAVKAAVKRKMGLGILFRGTIEPELRSGEFKIIKLPVGNFSGETFIVSHKGKRLTRTARQFLDLLRESQQKVARRPRKPREMELEAPASNHAAMN